MSTKRERIMERRDRINSSLPNELIMEILRRVDSKPNRDACSLVCKRWLALERLTRETVRIGASASPDRLVRILSQLFLSVKNVFVDERVSVSLPERRVRRRHGIRSSPSEHRTSGRQSVSEDNEIGLSCLSDSGLAAVGECFIKIEKLSLIWCSSITDEGLKSFCEKSRSLKSLDLQGCYIGDEGLTALGKFCGCLEELNLRFCEGMTDKGLIQVTLGCGRTLKSLAIAACAKITDSSLEAVGSHCKALESLSLDSDTVQNRGFLAVAKGCPQLKLLKLQCSNVTDEALQDLGNFCLQLESLALYAFQKFSDRSMHAIGKGCKKMKSLSLNDCYFLSSQALDSVAVGCPELTHIEINGCHNIGTNGLRSIGKHCSQLTELSLLYCQRIERDAFSQVGKGCKFLQTLYLVDCSGIGDESICSIAQGCKYLKKLHLRRCYEVGNHGLIAIGQNCKYLKDLSIRFCDRVGDEALISIGQGCSLQHLNVSGCHQIGDDGIIAVAKGSPELTYLDVSVLQNIGDKALMELGDGCPQLREIVLSHCRGITDVGLEYLARECSYLESCHMVYCPRITAAGVSTMVTSCSRMKKILVERFKVTDRTRRRAGPIINYLCIEIV